MGLYVSTVSGDVVISDLGITLSHPTSDYQLDAQFSSEDIKLSTDLYNAITGGSLTWSKDGVIDELGSDYDVDYLEVEQESTGSGDSNDRVMVWKNFNFLTTKGDIFVRGASNIVRFPRGQDGQILETDSNEDEGLKWVDKSGVTAEGRTFNWIFTSLGVTANKWLGRSQIGASDSIVSPFEFKVRLLGLEYANANNGAYTDVELWKNGTTKVYTWDLDNKRYAWKSNFTTNPVFDQGDYLGIYLKGIIGETSPRDVLIGLTFEIIDATEGEGGASSL